MEFRSDDPSLPAAAVSFPRSSVSKRFLSQIQFRATVQLARSPPSDCQFHLRRIGFRALVNLQRKAYVRKSIAARYGRARPKRRFLRSVGEEVEAKSRGLVCRTRS